MVRVLALVEYSHAHLCVERCGMRDAGWDWAGVGRSREGGRKVRQVGGGRS